MATGGERKYAPIFPPSARLAGLRLKLWTLLVEFFCGSSLLHVCPHLMRDCSPDAPRVCLCLCIVLFFMGLECRHACAGGRDTHTFTVCTAGFIFSTWHLYNQGDTGGNKGTEKNISCIFLASVYCFSWFIPLCFCI